jgi:hypothetical protein
MYQRRTQGYRNHQIWQGSKMGINSWKPHFFAWWKHKEYAIPIPKDEVFLYTDEEYKLSKLYNLTAPQLKWRRVKMLSMDKPELFPQEYPSNDIEAFMFSGRNRFSPERLKIYYANCKEPKAVGNFKRVFDKLYFSPNEKGIVKIYEQPQKNLPYVIGADCAEGVHKDFSAAVVLDGKNKNVVATLHGDLVPTEFGRELSKLGQYYNKALQTVEVNNHGLTTLMHLKEDEEYPNIYYRTSLDKAANKKVTAIGWKTTESSKKFMLDALDKEIRDGTIGIPSREIIEECMSYILTSEGKAQAQKGGHDDFVVATAIALMGLNDITKYSFAKGIFPNNSRVVTAHNFSRRSY